MSDRGSRLLYGLPSNERILVAAEHYYMADTRRSTLHAVITGLPVGFGRLVSKERRWRTSLAAATARWRC